MKVNCPHCRTPVEWLPENEYRPFCSERCKLIDLGAWAEERYSIPSEDQDEWGATSQSTSEEMTDESGQYLH